jgi:sugar lactone lactonase YvrE
MMRATELAGAGRRRALLLVSMLAMAVLAVPGGASAYTAASGYSASDYAFDFASAPCCGFGPVGVAFDSSDNLYVGDAADGHIYRFQPGGGKAGPATRLSTSPIGGGPKGLAFSGGKLYLARGKADDVVEIDQGSGAVKRTVADGIDCATGLATDPASGDLFVSQGTCTNNVLRISDFTSGKGTVKRYSSTPCCADGLAFAPDGTLYVASADSVIQIDGTAASSPGFARSVAHVPHADGVAVGVPKAGEDPFIVVNRTDGNVTRVDFSKSPPQQSPVLSGGLRGDFVAVDSHGCLFATQTSSVLRIAPPNNHCDLAPSTPVAGGAAPAAGIVIDTVGGVANAGKKARKCVVSGRLVVRVRQRGRVRLKLVRVYVKGRYRKTVRHRRVSAPIVIRRVPLGKFKVKLVARTTRGRKLTATKTYRVCRKGAIARHR